jgi:hypothetical protein
MKLTDKNLRFICAQPAIKYYAWQVEVMLNNFRKNGINLNDVDIVCSKPDGVIPEEWSKLANNYAARFFFYDDLRVDKGYISSIRPNILKQHFIKNPDLEREAILYHDCDIVFTKPIDWIYQYVNGDEWYGSDTRWYIAHSYIESKGRDVIEEMCKIANIDEQVVKDNELNSIGAQYLMKNVNAKYWDDVERLCEKLFVDITQLNNRKKQADPTHHELQIWCADMWSVLWEAWKRGYKTNCEDDLQFGWATSGTSDWEKFNIFHNAGVTDSAGGLFYKAEYMNELPYNKPLEIKKDSASWYYWNEINETAQKSCLL